MATCCEFPGAENTHNAMKRNSIFGHTRAWIRAKWSLIQVLFTTLLFINANNYIDPQLLNANKVNI